MIKYDSNSIYERELARLQQNPDWQVIANNSTVSSLLRTEAEALAEVGRYAEYLFKESKWDTAQNPNSILAMAGILNYQPKRARSATGTLYVSLDPKIHSVGTSISLQEFKALNSASSYFQQDWYTPSQNIQIIPSALITDSTGARYVVQTSGELKQAAPYTTVTIIQGTPASQYIDIATIRKTSTRSRLNPYLYIPITLPNCEDASTPVTRNFFRVTVFSKSANPAQLLSREYVVVDSLLLCTADDYAVEAYNDLYNPNLFYLKFPGDASLGHTLDISENSSIVSIKVDYLQSLGAAGNISEAFRNFTIETQSQGQQVRLYGINLTPFTNGYDPETISEVRINAPQYYTKNYTVGTRESYENLIRNATLRVKITDLDLERTIDLIPKKVRVYSGTDLESDGRQIRKTKVSFIADGLEDIVTSYSSISETIYDNIREALNLYLDKFKSPQDILKFEPPTYIPFAVGVELILDKEVNSNPNQLVLDIRNYVDELWGSTSSSLDFDRPFYPSALSSQIKEKFADQGVEAADIQVEAITKLNWSLATRLIPDKSQTDIIYHTMRVPFSFNPIFLGKANQKGFKDFQSGAGNGSYVLRFDVFYKKPAAMATVSTTSYDSSIFIRDVLTTRSSQAFYLVHDSSASKALWDNVLTDTEDYLELQSASKLTESFQFPLRQEVYTDSSFQSLIKTDSAIPVRGTSQTDLGAIDDYLVYFSANYADTADKIGDGWIEFSFNSLYQMLSIFKAYDPSLAYALSSCPLAVLQCNTGSTLENASTIFENFLEILAQYVDIYVSMRPIDSNLEITSGKETENSVLMIDSTDITSVSLNNIENLTAVKAPRMISVTYRYN